MQDHFALIGFGEAGQAFARAGQWQARAHVYDSTPAKAAAYAPLGVTGCASAAEALAGQSLVLSLVTADQALAAARDYAPLLAPGALWCDMNSVAPSTKQAARDAIEAAGGRYADVAVMAPVSPKTLGVPMLVSGPHAEAAVAALTALGFTPRVAGAQVGDASAIKMIRSVMVKGIEALTAECLLAATKAGVTDEVLASLDASWKEQSWRDRGDYNLDRMLEHGLRRAAEMEESARMLEDLGFDPAMTRGTIAVQRQLGALGLRPLPEGLDAKLAAVLGDGHSKRNAA